MNLIKNVKGRESDRQKLTKKNYGIAAIVLSFFGDDKGEE